MAPLDSGETIRDASFCILFIYIGLPNNNIIYYIITVCIGCWWLPRHSVSIDYSKLFVHDSEALQ